MRTEKTEYVDAVKAEDDGVVSDQELQEVQERPAGSARNTAAGSEGY